MVDIYLPNVESIVATTTKKQLEMLQKYKVELADNVLTKSRMGYNEAYIIIDSNYISALTSWIISQSYDCETILCSEGCKIFVKWKTTLTAEEEFLD